MINYSVIKDKNNEVVSVKRSDGWSIPPILDNTDYQEYLKWVAEGNEPEAAE